MISPFGLRVCDVCSELFDGGLIVELEAGNRESWVNVCADCEDDFWLAVWLAS